VTRPVADGHFHLFVYGTLRMAGEASALLDGCVRVMHASVLGTLYDIEGEFPALMLYGGTAVRGEVWRCPFERLARLDAYEAVERGLFRRVAVVVAGVPCWTYVAGPALAHQLTPGQRLASGEWPHSAAGRRSATNP
jgi:gamma-glutamylcyclotransferase (GGCT)/AIG2-like uncharacterized protein YtfP